MRGFAHSVVAAVINAALALAWTLPASAQEVLSESSPLGPSAETRAPEDRIAAAPILVVGVLTFGVAYGAAIFGATEAETRSDRWLFVPFVGPWAALAPEEGCGRGAGHPSCIREPLDQVALVANGTFQAFGLALLLAGVSVAAEPAPGVRVTPVTGRAGTGLMATGRF